MKQLLIILSLVFVFGVNAVANTPDTKSTQPEMKMSPEGMLEDRRPFMITKPHLCQQGDAFIDVLESKGEYRAFMGQGQLMKDDGSKIYVWVFTAVNITTQTFTIFEFHPNYNMACVLAVGQGFQILEGELPENTSVNVRKLLTL
tara:strand:+ start:13881 stop:14315 length:435 start_codon:yes stop_codon:yes gene_type:complete